MATKQNKQAVTKALFIKNLPYELVNAFKAWCALRNVTMRDKLVSMIRQVLKETKE